jgi:hypothetical protein
VELAMRQFLASKNSGCLFARQFATANKAPIDWIMPVGGLSDLAGHLDDAFDDAAKTSHAAIVVFPDIETQAALVSLLVRLAKSERWTFREVARSQTRESDLLLGIEWRTARMHQSSIMGLAPFVTMPIYRRAPHVGLALWPGDHENKHWDVRPERLGEVGLVDMPTGLSKVRHGATKNESHALTKALRPLPRSDAARPNIAFCLRATARRRLVEECGMITPR